MHFYCSNDAVPWLYLAKSWILWCTVIFKNFQIHLYFIWVAPAVRPGSAMCTGLIFLTKNVIGVYNMNPLFRKDLFTVPWWFLSSFICLHCSFLRWHYCYITVKIGANWHTDIIILIHFDEALYYTCSCNLYFIPIAVNLLKN